MGSVGSQVVTAARVAVAAVVGIAVVVGCSASGDSDPALDSTPTDPAAMMPPSAALPASGGPVDTADSSTPPPKDAGAKDSAVDAGPPPPVPGTPCPTLNELKKKKCGACGQQATLCLSDADAGDGGAAGGTWAPYGPCENELAGGCIPGTTITQAC